MKKIVYIHPEAEMVLLNNYDVIQTSNVTDDNPIKRFANDEGGLPTVGWKA